MLPRALLSVPVAALVFALPCVASAELTYPGALQSALGLSYAPPCCTCHVGVPGRTTPTTPFALAMQARGLGGGPDTVAPAAMKMAADKVDSDEDGTDDIEQLEQGRDPNGDRPGVCEYVGTDTSPLTAYGCDAQLAPGSAPWQGALALATVAALAFGRRRRPR